jgi:hypothetical protein
VAILDLKIGGGGARGTIRLGAMHPETRARSARVRAAGALFVGSGVYPPEVF